MTTFTFNVPVPTDEGYIGRECNNPDCKKYFKVHQDSWRTEMVCPYCGIEFSNDELWTQDQIGYLQDAAKEQALELVQGLFQDSFKKAFRGSKHITYKPGRKYRAKRVEPNYREAQVDSQIHCEHCKFSFQVYGIFAYCPGCKGENLRIYDANLEIIKQEVSASSNSQRALRHAYSDLISTFEIVSKNRAKSFTTDTTNFQDLYGTRKFFKKQIGIDIFAGIPETELRSMQRVFLKRHVFVHEDGIIGERYIRMMPEDAHLLNQPAELSIDEFEKAAKTLRKVLDTMVAATT